MTDIQEEVARVLREEHDRQDRKHREMVKRHIQIMLMIYRARGRIPRATKAKTPRVRQHPRGKK